MIRCIGRYELLEQVGTGGMAAVYRGRDTALDREVAVKVLHPHLAARAESRARFSREARAVARLAHPGIVEIFDYAGDAAEESWLVTEFVRGRTLRAFAEEVGFGYPEIGVLVGRALADALVHAHGAGVIHRDLKPENVLVSEGPGRRAVKLADFGIAKIVASDERMTMTGALVGSPNHMAPEIIEGREADARSDIFSLGTIVYWLATGRMPFAAPNPSATLRRVIEGDYQDPRAASLLVSDRLAAAVARALERDPVRRPESAAELRAALDAVLLDVGLEDPEAELDAFLSDPASYRRAFPGRAVAALLAGGERALGERATARALAAFNRVLAYEPDHPRVLSRLRLVSRRARVRRLLGASGLALAAALLVFAAGAALRFRTAASLPAPRAPRTPIASLTPTPIVAPTPTPTASRAHAPARRPRAPAAAAAVPPQPSDPVELAVHVRPYAQRALLDGVEVARGEQRLTFRIAPGKPHLIQIEHACCDPFVRRIDAEEAARAGELKVPLVPRPAMLRVQGDPTTRIYVGEDLLGTAGESQHAPIPVAIPPGENPYEGEVQLRLEPPGQEAVTAPVRVRAGADVVVAAPKVEAAP